MRSWISFLSVCFEVQSLFSHQGQAQQFGQKHSWNFAPSLHDSIMQMVLWLHILDANLQFHHILKRYAGMLSDNFVKQWIHCHIAESSLLWFNFCVVVQYPAGSWQQIRSLLCSRRNEHCQEKYPVRRWCLYDTQWRLSIPKYARKYPPFIPITPFLHFDTQFEPQLVIWDVWLIPYAF